MFDLNSTWGRTREDAINNAGPIAYKAFLKELDILMADEIAQGYADLARSDVPEPDDSPRSD